MTTPMRAPDPSDPDAPPSDEELREAAALRDALDDVRVPHEGASLARALVLAHTQPALEEAAHRALVDRALRVPASAKATTRPSARTFAWAAAAVATLSIAAGWLVAQRPTSETVATPALALHEARSTQPLFREPFAERGAGSRRIDRIVSARASDLRENRYARWTLQ